MQSTFHKTLTNTIEKLFKKVAKKWTFILLCLNGNSLAGCQERCARRYIICSQRRGFCGVANFQVIHHLLSHGVILKEKQSQSIHLVIFINCVNCF